MKDKAVFIDRDGTINVDVDFLDDPKDFRIYPTVANGIKLLNKNGFKIIIVSNQSGVGRGYFSEAIVEKIHETMKYELAKKGAKIDAIYYCPHHPEVGCDCRKPKTGLLDRAVLDLDIDIKHSYLIGDRMRDIEAGHKMGCKTILIPENKDKIVKEIAKSSIKPDYICDNFHLGAMWILRDCKNNN